MDGYSIPTFWGKLNFLKKPQKVYMQSAQVSEIIVHIVTIDVGSHEFLSLTVP